MKHLLQRLMSSSDFAENEIRNFSVIAIRELVFRATSVILPVVIVPGILFNALTGRGQLALVETGLMVLFVMNAWLLLSRNVRIVGPLTYLLVAFAILLMTVLDGVPEFIYFCLAFPVAFYLLVDVRQSFVINIFWCVVCCVLAPFVLLPLAATAYIFTHIFTFLFLEILFAILAHSENQLKQLAVRDPLTNALNRRAMKESMEYALQMHSRYHMASSIVMIDIDNFKPINDNFGHREGDLVLKNLVALLSERLRGTDRLCRYGGEEFVLVLPNTHRDQAYQMAELVCERVRNTILTSKTRITISCGVAESLPEDTVRQWLDRGDEALYRAKDNGRDRVEIEDRERGGAQGAVSQSGRE